LPPRHEERPAPASPLTENAPMPAIRMAPDFALDGVRLPASAAAGAARVHLHELHQRLPLTSARMARLQQKLIAARLPAVLVP